MPMSSTLESETPVLTAAGREQLEARLDRALEALAVLAERMSHGDISDTDREEHRWLLRTVEELTAVLHNARGIGEIDEDPTIVELGDEVVIEFDDGTVDTYALVHPVEINPAEARISVASPLGDALLGAHAGDRVTVHAPSGAYECVIRERRRLA